MHRFVARRSAAAVLAVSGATALAAGTPAVAATLSGRVLERDTGRGAVHACVRAYPKANGSGMVATKADAQGRWRFIDLKPGAYGVVPDGCKGNDRYLSSGLPHVGSIPRAVTVRSTNAPVTLYVRRGGVIAGELTDAATGGQPDGLCASTTIGSNDPSGEFRASGSHYRLSPLVPGRHRLYFFECGRKWMQRSGSTKVIDDPGPDYPFMTTYFPGTPLRADAPEINVTAGRTSRVASVAVPHMGRISGHVQDPATGRPLAGLCVEYDSGTGPQAQYLYLALSGIGGTPTDANGDYSFLAPAGSYLVASTNDPVSYDTTRCDAPHTSFFWWPGSADKSAAQLVQIQPGTTTSHIDFTPSFSASA